MGGLHNPAMAAQASDCDKQITVVTSSADALPESMRALLDRRVSKASALARFHRRDDALAQLDLLTTLLAGSRGQQVQDDTLAKLTKSIDVLRRCLATVEPPPLATLTIRAVREGGTPAEEDVFLDVEGVRIGRSGSGGTFEAKVPSGTIEVKATEYPSSVGSDVVTIAPGGSQVATIVMADSKEPKEDSDLVLEEAPDDILPANPASVTLTFVQDDVPVRIDRIEEIEIADDRGETGESVEEFFAVSDGAIRAQVPSAVYRRMAEHVRIGRPLWLDVVLAPPPSNPALQVSNIRVRVSVVGTNIALTRTSDAQGRFQIETLPDTTLVFDAHTVASGNHYYLDSTLTMCADRSVTLLMRNVKDIVAGVRGLILDAGTPPCPHIPRR
jgi:hypothetical protein